MWLSNKERTYLNKIYASAYKKYFSMATDYGAEMDTERMEASALSYDDALALANVQLAAQREHINALFNGKIALAEANHSKKAALINTEAQKRGLANSTVVLHSLQAALNERNEKVEVLENDRTAKLGKLDETRESLARKIHNEAFKNAVAVRRLNVTIAQAKSAQQARSLTPRLRTTIPPTEAQKMLDEEVYAAYLSFLFNYSSSDAKLLVNNEPVFGMNLSASYYTKLQQEMARRGY